MRKLAVVALFVGGFLLVLGVLAQTYGADRLERTPLDVDTVTRLAGTAELGGPDGTEEFEVKVTSTTRVDSESSDADVVVFTSSQCVVRDEGDVGDCVSNDDPEERLLSASTDDFATDRRTGEAVNDADYLPSGAEPHEGLVNKWPFGAEQEDYDYWSGTTDQAVTATFDRTEEIDGLETNVYRVEISDAPIQVADGVDGLYNETTEIFVEPRTGSIVNQVGSQERTTEDGDLVLALDVAFTDDQVATSVEEAQSNASSLRLVTSTVPLIGYLVGIPLLLLGLVLGVLGRGGRRVGSEQQESADRQPVA